MVARVTTVQKDERLSLDLHAFGVLLLELITGQDSLTCDVDQVLVDQKADDWMLVIGMEPTGGQTPL
ncbi:hypothetical protein AAC387_Pa12g0333 [Persea americana]